MSQTVKVHYPDPSNCESAFLIIDTCQMGSFVTAGESSIIRFPVTYDRAKEMTAELSGIQGPNDFVKMHHSKGVLTIDVTLAAEIYAACVEIVVDVEIGEDLAMIEVEEYAEQKEAVYAYC